MPRYYLKFLGGADKVNALVGIAPDNHGTTLLGLTKLLPYFPGVEDLLTTNTPGLADQVAGSAFLTKLNAGGDTVPGVRYTVIATRYDEVVTPYRTQFLDGPDVRNVLLQDLCPVDLSEHVGDRAHRPDRLPRGGQRPRPGARHPDAPAASVDRLRRPPRPGRAGASPAGPASRTGQRPCAAAARRTSADRDEQGARRRGQRGGAADREVRGGCCRHRSRRGLVRRRARAPPLGCGALCGRGSVGRRRRRRRRGRPGLRRCRRRRHRGRGARRTTCRRPSSISCSDGADAVGRRGGRDGAGRRRCRCPPNDTSEQV